MSTEKSRLKHLLFMWGRYVIAIVGVTWILMSIHYRDRVWVVDPSTRVREQLLVLEAPASSAGSWTLSRGTGDPIKGVSFEQFVLQRKGDSVVLADGGSTRLYAVAITADPVTYAARAVKGYWVGDSDTAALRYVEPAALKSAAAFQPGYPVVEKGMVNLVLGAKTSMLLLSVLLFPGVLLINSFRWKKLLEPLDVNLSYLRCVALTMVGAFYNTFMPGQTGGDVIRAWYATRQTENRAAAAFSVFLDRAIGLLGFLAIGGLMASVQYLVSADRTDPVARACLKVAAFSSLGVLGAALAAVLVISKRLRRYTGLSHIGRKLPFQKQLRDILEILTVYRRQPRQILLALATTVPVQILLVGSAIFAGVAFSLPVEPMYYFVFVPVVLLAGAMPISPQGIGVMEFFAVAFTSRQGATVSQAFALTMAIRLVQILWNLTGGIFVFFGDYHRPPASASPEQASPVTQP